MSEFKPTYILKILHLIHYQLSVGELVELGLDYSQVADLISEVIQNGLVENSPDSGLNLTKSGLELLEKLNAGIYPANSNNWMLPLDEYRVPKIEKFDIYLPKRKKKMG